MISFFIFDASNGVRLCSLFGLAFELPALGAKDGMDSELAELTS